MRSAAAGLLACWLAGCAAAPADPFQRAEQALLANDLPGALLAYDAVPVAHPRYPEARAAVAGVERRLRRSHEILLEGMLRRAEWRDREALACLQRAKAVWPTLPGVDAIIAATEHRLATFGDGAAAGPAAVAAAVPLLPATGLAAYAAPVAPGAAPAPLPPPATLSAPGPTAPAGGGEPVAPELPRSLDPVALGLVAVESRLARGELEAAVADLMELASRHPRDARLERRLARLLHQRALLRYGQGALTAAIADWERVLQLEPGHAAARHLLDGARAEAAVPPR